MSDEFNEELGFDWEEFEKQFEDKVVGKFSKDDVADFITHQKEELEKRFNIDFDQIEISTVERLTINALQACKSIFDNYMITVDPEELNKDIHEVVTLVIVSLEAAQQRVTKSILEQISEQDKD